MADDVEAATLRALIELRDADKRGKPLLVWLGAGASRWADLPTWEELASLLHSEFLKHEGSYNKVTGAALLRTQAFPALFSLIKASNPQRFFESLNRSLRVRAPTPVFSRLISQLRRVKPLFLITTNVDEMVESNLVDIPRYQYSDLEFASRSMSQGQSFVTKLHGSTSAVQGMIWTTEDYQAFTTQASIMATLQHMLRSSQVLFIGYGLRDQYVLDLLKANGDAQPLLGDGPHYLASSVERGDLPSAVRVIRYHPGPLSDHRSAISVLDVIANKEPTATPPKAPQPRSVSALYLPEYIPPGTHSTSQAITFSSVSEPPREARAVVGPGWINDEVSSPVTTSLHDLIVGLLCFDSIYLPVSSLGRIHSDLGSETFWLLIDEGVLKLIWIEGELAVIFRSKDSVSAGDLGFLTLQSVRNPGQKISLAETILKQIGPSVPSPAAEDQIVQRLSAVTTSTPESIGLALPKLTRNALLSPTLRAALGIGDAILPTQLPEWFVFPALRVGQIVRDAEVSRMLGVSSARVRRTADR